MSHKPSIHQNLIFQIKHAQSEYVLRYNFVYCVWQFSASPVKGWCCKFENKLKKCSSCKVYERFSQNTLVLLRVEAAKQSKISLKHYSNNQKWPVLANFNKISIKAACCLLKLASKKRVTLYSNLVFEKC